MSKPFVDDNEMNLTEFYESWAKDQFLANESYVNDIQNLKADAFISHLKESGLPLPLTSVVDLGCSTGLILKKIGAAVGADNLLGVDLSKMTVDRANELNAGVLNITFRQCDESPESVAEILKIYCQEKGIHKISAVIMIDFLEHVADPARYVEILKPWCEYFFIKIPVENTIWDNKLMTRLGKKVWPGKNQGDGHLWEIDYHNCRHFASRVGLTRIWDYYWKHSDYVQFAPHVLKDWDTKPFYKRLMWHSLRALHNGIKKFCSTKLTLKLIGGSYFCIAK